MDIIFYLALIVTFFASLQFTRKLLRFLFIIFLDDKVTVRYFKKDGSVVSKKITVRKEGDILTALDELRDEAAGTS